MTRCIPETTGETSRRICAPAAVGSQFSVELPETAPPVTTDGGRGLSFAILAPLPPEFEAVIPEKDLASLRPAPLPPFPPSRSRRPSLRLRRPRRRFHPPPPATAEAAQPLKRPRCRPEARSGMRFGGSRPRNRLSEREADQALAFYEAREFRPLWIENGRWSDRALTLRAAFARAGDDGAGPEEVPHRRALHRRRRTQWPALAAARGADDRSGADLRPRRGERPGEGLARCIRSSRPISATPRPMRCYGCSTRRGTPRRRARILPSAPCPVQVAADGAGHRSRQPAPPPSPGSRYRRASDTRRHAGPARAADPRAARHGL